MSRQERWDYHLMPLSAGEVADKGALACIDTSTGEVVAGQASTTLLPIGWFDESVDNSAGMDTVDVNVKFFVELTVAFWANSGGSAVASSDVGSSCYIEDDRTVSMSSSGNSVAGMVILVDTRKGVGVVMKGL